MPRGIPHSVFLGRKVRPGIDPAWLDTDRDLALAWTANKAATCSGCGTRHDEWDPALGGDRQAYLADLHHCPGCEALAAKRDEVPASGDGQPMPGYRPYLVPAALYDALHPIPADD